MKGYFDFRIETCGPKIKTSIKSTKIRNSFNKITKGEKGSDIGPVLNWNPQTGSLQLSQIATKRLLASLGGHVTKRRDTGLTVFFPISDSK